MGKPRIVSLCPSNTELIDALGAAECIVGVDNYSDYPEEKLIHVPRLGPDLHIDIDQTVALKPDLVVCSLSVPGMEKVVEAIDAAGLPYVVLSPHTIDDIFHDLRSLGTALDGYVKEAHIEHLILNLRHRVERIRACTAMIDERPKLYWEWWPNPVFSPAKRNWLTEISSIAGGVNIFFDVDHDQVQDDGSRVIELNPDYFLAVWTGVPQDKVPVKKILSRAGWGQITAFEKRQMYVLSEGLYCRPSARLIDGLEQLTGLLHPHIAETLRLPPVDFHASIRYF